MDKLLFLLPALACPIVMGLMMWVMMRKPSHQTEQITKVSEANRMPSTRVGIPPTFRIGGLCLDMRVVAGLVAVAAVIWVLAPNLVGAALPLLVVALCPLSMLLMMRGMPKAESVSQPEQGSQLTNGAEQLVQLKAQQEALSSQIARLEAEGRASVRERQETPVPILAERQSGG